MSMNYDILYSPMVAVDTETTGLDMWHGDCPYMIQFCNAKGETGFMEWPVDPFTRIVYPDPTDLEVLEWFFAQQDIVKIFHHGKFDVRMIEENFGIQLLSTPEETMFMAHVCNSCENSLALKPLSEIYLGIDTNDQNALQSATARLRREATKLGWETAYDHKVGPDGREKWEAVVEADYWLIRAFEKWHPEVLKKKGIAPNLASVYGVRDVERTMLLAHMYFDAMKERQAEFDEIFDGIKEEHGAEEARRQYPINMDVEGTYQFERRLWPILYGMETRGLRLNVELCKEELERSRKEYLAYGAVIRDQCKKYNLPKLNIDHPASLGKLLFGKMGIEPKSFTEKGQPQVNQDALELYTDLPVVQAILRYRSSGKAFGTFFQTYLDAVIQDRISLDEFSLRTDLQQIGPRTGRLAARKPNLMQVADSNKSRSLEPIQARNVFGPRKGYLWLLCDYAGQEICIFADVAQEPQMISALNAGRKIHDECANIVWGGPNNDTGLRAITRTLQSCTMDANPSQEVLDMWKRFQIRDPRKLQWKDWEKVGNSLLKEHKYDIVKAEKSFGHGNSRSRIKIVEFLKIYGGHYAAAANVMKCPYEEAKETIDAFDDRFPRITEYMLELTEQSSRDGFVVTKYGRRLSVPHDRPYVCVNYIVQGTAADMMKWAMIRTHEYLKNSGADAHVLLPIHDELVFEIAEADFTKKLVRKICELMCINEGRFCVPIKVDPKVAREKWNEAEEIEL